MFGRTLKFLLTGLLTLSALYGQELASFRLFVLDFENRNPDGRQSVYVQELPRLVFSQELRLPEVQFFPGTEYEYYEGHRDDLQVLPGDTAPVQNLTLMGSYRQSVDNEFLDIQLQFVNIAPYRLISVRTCLGDTNDPFALAESMMHEIAKALGLTLLDASVLQDAVPEMDIDEAMLKELSREMKGLKESLGDIDRRYDSLSVYQSGTGKVNNVYYRKLNSTDAQADLDIAVMNQSTMQSALYEVIFNPYDAEIAEPDYINYPYEPDIVHVRLEISYNLQRTLINDVVELLPFRRIQPDGENYEYLNFQAKYSDIPFELRRKIQRGEYHVYPLVRFIGRNNSTIYSIYDEKFYVERALPPAGAPLQIETQFQPLLTLASGSTAIQLYLRESSQVCTYSLQLPVTAVKELDRITVEFIRSDDLESCLAKMK